jgi:transcriptional regulator with XRE-family HTH domain
MPARARVVDRARVDGRNAALALVRDAREHRLGASLTQAQVARATGISASRLSRIESGDVNALTFPQAAALLAAVGLRLHARAYPAGDPLRDAPQLDLLGRLRPGLHPSLGWRTEVGLPLARDLRAGDAVVSGDGWRLAVEAETRPRDLQALKRRIALKQRDGEMEHVLLLLANTRSNRTLVRTHVDDLIDLFPMPGRRMLDLLRAGLDPGSSGMVLL